MRKRERKRTNPYVVRLSELMSNIELEKNHDKQLPEKETEQILRSPSPVVIHPPQNEPNKQKDSSLKSNKSIAARYSEILANYGHKTTLGYSMMSPSTFQDMRTNCSSFTKVTRQINSTSQFQDDHTDSSENLQTSEVTVAEAEKITEETENNENLPILTEQEIDEILFDGKKLTNETILAANREPTRTNLSKNHSRLNPSKQNLKNFTDNTNFYPRNTFVIRKYRKFLKKQPGKAIKTYHFYPLDLNSE